MPLLQFTKAGIWCEQADVYIDPWRKVDRAIVTHGHSDHAKPGSRHYLCTELSKPILKQRLGKNINVSTLPFGHQVTVNGVKFSLHPASHIIGSAQVRVEYKGEVWVASGDYKTEDDGVSGSFEVVRCDTFITESTFGLPIYQWKPQNQVFANIDAWWGANTQNDTTSIITAYSLGKAQRLLYNVDHSIGPIYCHESVFNMNKVIRDSGVSLPQDRCIVDDVPWSELKGALIITPGNVFNTPWMRRFKQFQTAAASGWMAVRKRRSWQSVDKAFVLSDHADWPALNETILNTGCENVVVTHGYTESFAKWLTEQGLNAMTEKTAFGQEEGEV